MSASPPLPSPAQANGGDGLVFGFAQFRLARRRLAWPVGWLAALATILVVSPLHGQVFPKFANYVVDEANIIPAGTERELDRKLADLQRQTRHQLAVVTVPSLQGYAINDFSVRLARAWGIGRRKYDDGVLLLVAPAEHQVGIEVGYGLEAALTDPRCAEIIRSRILPHFKRGDFPRGVSAGAGAIMDRLKSAVPLESAGVIG